ncbi:MULTISPECIES: right-handed parallel beta-helix repeat-containing protein [unclassified Sinorhizobium]|uniref:right-handed parallel beta-helix repeat-containing protein n=1 Tax=unclassified Sinorhizobium TaxID=2613772 RepID=UPI0024C44FA8|nr:MULTISPECIES: right-handed parallel beta-helix repeat-containing protein [unclassified Sinorhizobium]MDK1374547.1 right-handed parallel beta-helix repeat-containing protein [Sinorhizobium sp. 6-70]MDK1478254.1 right-handed parallel beta-helix repeat-containing protein [Sinorhizobium sp. 6-117]
MMHPTKIIRLSLASLALASLALASLILASCQSDLAMVADAAFSQPPRPPVEQQPVPEQPTAPPAPAPEQVEPKPACGADVQAKLKAPGTNAVSLDCSIRLSPTDVVTHPLVFEGAAASGSQLDCGGGTIDASAGTSRRQKTAVVVRSSKVGSGAWSAPSNVTIRNCRINGFVRVHGLGENANGETMKASSLNANHTAFAQASAPKNVRLENVTFNAPDGIPLYIGPGVTGATLVDSRIDGKSTSVAVYLDAESANNTISNNVFGISTENRELIAIDGSANNRIANNTFEHPENGGIFVYRNCGEGGVIRHQKPEFNQITGNTFRYGSAFLTQPAVWLNSRNGNRSYCSDEPASPFGSSASNLDFAQHNVVRDNKLVGGSESLIRNDDPTNDIWGNMVTGG